MATTSTPILVLKLTGVRDTSGNVVASGKARFYNPGTLVAATVYSDAACTTGITQPVTLNSQGQATVYCLEPVRCIIKDSTEVTTYFDDVINLVRADSVYMTVSGVNGGAETTVENAFANVVTGLGADFKYRYLANASATARPYTTAIGERMVSVMDFGATGDGSTDDTTAIQNAINSGAGVVFFPEGTYKVTSALTILLNQSVWLRGAGRYNTIIKSFANINVFDLTTDGSADYGQYVSDMTITSNAGSTGGAIYGPTTNGIVVERVIVTSHATGIYLTGDHSAVRDCRVTYTGTANTNFGVYNPVGAVSHCRVTGPGTGGSDVGVAAAEAQRCIVVSCANGVQTGVASSLRVAAINCLASTCATGFVVPASCDIVSLVNCDATGSTTDLSVGSSVTNLSISGGSFLVSSHAGGTASYSPSLFMLPIAASSAAASPTFTPDFSTGSVLQTFTGSYAAGAQAVTIAAPTNTAYMPPGAIVWIQLIKTGANAMNLSWGASYLDGDSSTFSGVTSVASNTEVTIAFQKLSSGSWRRLLIGAATAV